MELLGAGEVPPELLIQGLVALQVAVDRLVERLADVELLAGASLGRLTLCPELTSLAELVSPAPPDLEMLLGADATHVVVDAAMFRRVFRDLWLAAQLPPAPRVLRLESSLEGPWVEIRVVREADPINRALLTALFEPFGDENLNCDGTGITLGLYLARALSVAHGGAVGLEQDEDRLVFWVRVRRTPSVQHTTTPRARTPLAVISGE